MSAVVSTDLLPAADSPTYPIASVDNALRLIETLRDRGAIRVSEASLLIGCGRSTAHRLLAMLKHHGFAEQDPDTRLYRAGDGLPRLGRSPAVTFVSELARPVLQVLARATGETAHLCELRGGSAFFLESVASDAATGTGSRRGVAYPAHCVSGGKALLAQLPRDILRRLLGGDSLDTLTPASIGSLAALERNLRFVREHGYAINRGESQLGIAAVGVALPPASAIPPVALTVAGPAGRMTPERVEKLASILRRATATLVERIDATMFDPEGYGRVAYACEAEPRPRGRASVNRGDQS
jgi:IclR family transcriptional regulator, acetate operon repressor